MDFSIEKYRRGGFAGNTKQACSTKTNCATSFRWGSQVNYGPNRDHRNVWRMPGPLRFTAVVKKEQLELWIIFWSDTVRYTQIWPHTLWPDIHPYLAGRNRRRRIQGGVCKSDGGVSTIVLNESPHEHAILSPRARNDLAGSQVETKAAALHERMIRGPAEIATKTEGINKWFPVGVIDFARDAVHILTDGIRPLRRENVYFGSQGDDEFLAARGTLPFMGCVAGQVFEAPSASGRNFASESPLRWRPPTLPIKDGE